MAAAVNNVWLHESRCGIYLVTHRQRLAGLLRTNTNWSGVSTSPADCVSVNLIQETIKHILKETVSYVAQSSCAVLNAGRKSQFLTRI